MIDCASFVFSYCVAIDFQYLMCGFAACGLLLSGSYESLARVS